MKSRIDKEKVIKKYIKGYTATEIAEMIGQKRDAVIKCIYIDIIVNYQKRKFQQWNGLIQIIEFS